jgi:hypothetical protein
MQRPAAPSIRSAREVVVGRLRRRVDEVYLLDGFETK